MVPTNGPHAHFFSRNALVTTDTELKRVSTRVDRQERLKEKKATENIQPTGTYLSARTTPVVENRRSATPSAGKPSENCFNCDKPGHYARECTEPKRTTDLKDIEEEGDDSESGKEYA